MKEKTLEYSVLRYSPSTGERINLGIIFSEKQLHYMEFKFTKSLTRLSRFDDEIDINMVKLLLSSIKEDVEGSIFDYREKDIKEYIKFYDNDFSFDPPLSISYEGLEDTMERLMQVYFRFDLPKHKRSSSREDRKFLESVLASSCDNVRKNERTAGVCNETIRYDYSTDEYKIKWFDFDNEDLVKLIPSIKSWAWNSINDKDQKTIIVYRYNNEIESLNDFQIIMKIFEISNVRAIELSNIAQLFG